VNCDDSVIWSLIDVVDPRAMKVSPEKLAERRRRRWVQKTGCGNVQARQVRLTGDEQPVRASRYTDFKDYRAVGGLMNPLNPTAAEYRTDFLKDQRNFYRGQCHRLCRNAAQGIERKSILSHEANQVAFCVAEARSDAATLRFAAKTRKSASRVSGIFIA
jgi:hypothetical protein